ncbi:hypothetical protein Tco_0733202 [Tanacetum coccineum]
MVLVPINQDTSLVPPMTTPVIDITTMQSDSPLPTSTATTSIITTTTTIPPTPQPQQSTTDPILVHRIGELEQHMTDLVQDNLALGERLDKHGTQLYNLENLDIPHKKSLELDYSNQRLADQEEARKKQRKRHDAPRSTHGSPPSHPPPPPPLAGVSGGPGTPGASGSSQFLPPPPPPSTEERPATPEPAWTIPSSHKSDVENNWASALATTYEPPAENSLLAKIGDMTTFLNSYCQRMNKTVRTQADFEGHAYEVIKPFYPDVIHIQFQMEECHKMLVDQVDWANPEGDQVRINVNRPLPLGGPPGYVPIQTKLFFNKDLEYLRYGSKGSCPTLSISKIKAASYPDFGLELLVPEQMWIDDVCTYDVSEKYSISHWWFTQQKIYIDRHESSSRQKEVRTHMRILSVVKIKAYSRYGYDYLSEIVLRRADHQEQKIAEKDFKNLYPSDFEDLNFLLLQGHLDHLSGSDKWVLSTAVKLWTRNLVIRQQTEKDVTRSKEFITAIERRLKTRRIYQNLECFVGRRVRDIDYRLLQRTE